MQMVRLIASDVHKFHPANTTHNQPTNEKETTKCTVTMEKKRTGGDGNSDIQKFRV